jgi:phage gpG-like protein
MSYTIEMAVSSQARLAIDRLKDSPGALRAIARRMDFENNLTIEQIRRFHLSGPTTDSSLSVRTSRLRGSIRSTQPIVTADGVESSIGSNLIYAGVHEFGFEGEVQVRPHNRTSRKFQKFKFGGKTINRKIRGADIRVGTFKRQMRIPARAPIGHGIADRAEDYGAGISTAITEFYTGK